jgi:hypothetical protein
VAYALGDEETRRLVSEKGCEGPIIGSLHLKLNHFEIPTQSSSWLNMLKLNVLDSEIGIEGLNILNEFGFDYKRRLLNLVGDYKDFENPFFQTLAYLADSNSDISFIEKRLAEYPYPVKAGRIVNSHRVEVEVRDKRYIKNTAKVEATKALPLYEITSDHYLWKRNLLELDRQGDDSVKEYYGVDFLQAYWMFEYAKMKNQNLPDK